MHIVAETSPSFGFATESVFLAGLPAGGEKGTAVGKMIKEISSVINALSAKTTGSVAPAGKIVTTGDFPSACTFFNSGGYLQFFEEPEDTLRAGLIEPGFVSLVGDMGWMGWGERYERRYVYWREGKEEENGYQ
ncbi:hypothetical protein BPOR_0310g00020 [Botrytis porri]|uniref:Uncharacterized protein n=1 Tax=Botrytis porri TaxID=87229 RepID=A0A4Z1KJU9_9HELO|nr:hypothetical protein BPOR_0310g00020 [Botrytis porri]